jgi:hypothetical protein
MATLALAFFFKILAYFSLYITKSELRAFKYLGEGVYQVHLFNAAQASFFLIHAAIMTAGLFILYSTVSEKKSKNDMILIVCLMILTLIFSHDETYAAFNLLALILLLLISLSFLETYKINKLTTTKLLAISFFVVALSKVFFLLANIHQLVYVLAEFIQLAGFILLLFTLRLVLKNAKKTR